MRIDGFTTQRELPVVAITGIARWAAAVIGLAARESLPTRLVLVPSEAHAHALRVELAVHSPRTLAGTRFFTAAAAARAVLDDAGIAYRLGEEARRPLRLRKLFRARPALRAYRIEDLGTSGWEGAFASTIDQLEASALRPDDLERLGDERAADLATVWRALDEDAGASWTVPRAMAEASNVLARDPGRWPFDAPVLAAVSAGIDAVHARMLRAIPNLTCGVLLGRPARQRMLERMRALLGGEVAEALAATDDAEPRPGELGILSQLLFEAPDRLAAPTRRRSEGPDGSVSLELHAGVDEELDAAVRWVAEQILEHGTALQDIAVLVPTPDPLATLIADRLASLPWLAAAAPVYLACGRPATATAAGARLLAIVQALASHLSAEAVAAILPRLRLAGQGPQRHLSPGRARGVVRLLATPGGSAARPEAALHWTNRLTREELDPSVRAIAPALEALVAVAKDMVAGASLGQLWNAIQAFVSTYVIAPDDMSSILDELDADLSSLAGDPVAEGVVGRAAVAVIAARLQALRLHAGRYGEPAIYVGTITGAAGLSFSAVRVLGLAEGAFPGTLREDSILPSDLRRRLPAFAMTSDDDFATARLHALDQLVRGATSRVALSTPRVDFDGSEREPAAVLVEAAAALGRPDAITGEPGRVVPTVSDLERDAFRGARAAMEGRRAISPVSAADWLRVVATERGELPSSWSLVTVTDPRSVVERAATMDGLLGPAGLARNVPGRSAERPLSASALRVLLACPQRFLLERILGFWARTDGPSTHRIDAVAYGDLFHRVAEAFSRAHGPSFGAREHDLEHWRARADAMACAVFEAFLDEYPLVGDAVIDVERTRLRRDVRTFVADDWNEGRPRTFVAAEREFGDAVPLALSTSAGPLFVTGRIDRIDVEGSLTLVRDLKTGRALPRERDLYDPDVAIDLQLAVYVAVAQRLAPEWNVPAEVAGAYVYVDRLASQRERGFRADRRALQTAGGRWLDLAASLLRDQAFVRTTDAADCLHCPFSAVCGDSTSETAEQLVEASGVLAAFRDLKR